ncbi:MAG TPA: hypothetical protein VGD06_10235 [Acidobacteriota bacterium]|jgi:hypothetical protein
MGWLQLDPAGIAARARTADSVRVPTLAASMGRGAVGFAIVSVAGFAPWAFLGRWLGQTVGELGLYAACALVFVGLSGLLLHPLVIGPGSLPRFYKLFTPAFLAYSIGWIAGWMGLGGHLGGLLGLLAGTAIMGWILVTAFEASGALVKVVAALFVLNAIGYFAGGWIAYGVMGSESLPLIGNVVSRGTQMRIGMLLWGVFYGLGLGAGLGYAFHACQERARQLLLATS